MMAVRAGRFLSCFSRLSSRNLILSPRKPPVKTLQWNYWANLSRNSSTFVNVTKHAGYSIVEMNRKPVNSLSLEMMTELTNVIDNLESDPDCQGMILSSGLPKIFSAGLDITEFMKKDEDRLKSFWKSFQNIWLKLYGSRLATIAAINGASPAGGCLLAISCDYRIMADGFFIGPNETLLGIVPPFWFQDVLINTIGHRHTEHFVSIGKLLTSQEACAVGMVDKVVENNAVVDEAKNEIAKWLAIPAEARVAAKLSLRNPTLEKLHFARDEDLNIFMELLQRDSTQKSLAWYMKKLAEKSKK